MESNVRYYSRSYEAEFQSSKGCYLYDGEGRAWLDFLSSAGSLNYGHNEEKTNEALINYIRNSGVTNSLDMNTQSKRLFIETFVEQVLKPRGLNHKIQFCGPTGTNSIEAALKLAKKVTGRKQTCAFRNGFHGMTQGSLSITDNKNRSSNRYLPVNESIDFLPFGTTYSDIESLEKYYHYIKSSENKPACFVLELIQGEGGINVVNREWLHKLVDIAKKLGALLVVDDIQMGCGRTGKFFSFEHFSIEPDIICLSKSISGSGLPMSLLLMKPEHDVWDPGEHNGTFRGFNYAFVTAKEVINNYWKSEDFISSLETKSEILESLTEEIASRYPRVIKSYRGIGLVWAIEFSSAEKANNVRELCYSEGLIVEICGSDGSTIKIMPPIVIELSDILYGYEMINKVLSKVEMYV